MSSGSVSAVFSGSLLFFATSFFRNSTASSSISLAWSLDPDCAICSAALRIANNRSVMG